MLALEAKAYGTSQLVILDNMAYTGSSVTDVDAQTKRVSVTLSEDMRGVDTSGNIGLLGLATVKDTSPGSDAPPRSSQFSLDLTVGEFVRSLLSFARTIFSASDSN